MKRYVVEHIFKTFEKNNHQPTTELKYNNHYTLLVAVVLSAQSTDKGVNKATQKLFRLYDTPSTMLNLGLEDLIEYIKTIGLYNTKAKNIIALSQILLDKYNGAVPDKLEALVELPGVGRKTANVVLSCAFKQPTIPVDTHMIRVSNRLGFTTNKNPDKIELDLIEIIPKQWLYNAHHWMVLHGRYICKAKNPLCQDCIISQYCEYYNNK